VADLSTRTLANLVAKKHHLLASGSHPVVCLDIQQYQVNVGIMLQGRLVYTISKSSLHDTHDIEEGLAEILHAVDLFCCMTIDPTIEQVFITGSSIQCEAYRAKLAEKMQVTVDVIDPLKDLLVELPFLYDFKDLPNSAMAVGLACRCLEDQDSLLESASGINLLHSQTAQAQTIVRRHQNFDNMKTGTLIVFGLAVLFGVIVAGTVVGNLLMR
jgi:hypothetical protein